MADTPPPTLNYGRPSPPPPPRLRRYVLFAIALLLIGGWVARVVYTWRASEVRMRASMDDLLESTGSNLERMAAETRRAAIEIDQAQTRFIAELEETQTRAIADLEKAQTQVTGEDRALLEKSIANAKKVLADAKHNRAMQLSEREYNARVEPFLKGDPRFVWVFKGGEAGYITNTISPVGVVEAPADLAALRAVLESANPPMPLDLQYITVKSPAATTRPARAGR